MRIVCAIVASAMTVSVPVVARAQTRTDNIGIARAIVARLHIAATLDPLLNQLMPLMVGNVEAAMANAKDTPAPLRQRLASDAGRQQVGAIIAEEFGAAFRSKYPDIDEGIAEEYSKSFDADQLAAILSFYSSPTGAKLLKLQPALQQKLSEQGRALGQDAAMIAFPKIEARIRALDAPASQR